MEPTYTYFSPTGSFWIIAQVGLSEEEKHNISDKVEAGKYVLYPDSMAAYKAGMKWQKEMRG